MIYAGKKEYWYTINSNQGVLYSLLVCILMISLIPVEGLYYISPLVYDILYRYIASAAVVIILFLSFLYILQGKSISMVTGMLVLIALYNIIFTLCSGGNTSKAVSCWMYSCGLLLLFEITKNHAKAFLELLQKYLEVILWINLICIILFPNGMVQGDINRIGKIWLLGYKSSLQYYVFPLLVLSYLKSIHKGSERHFTILLIVSHLECIASSNSMLLVGLVLFDIVYILKLPAKQIANINLFGIIIIAANVVIVGFTSWFFTSRISQVLVYNILGKDATFSMRTYVWANAIKSIAVQPLVGYGYTSEIHRTMLFGRVVAHAHNLFLELLIQGGIVIMLQFIILNMSMIKRLRNSITSLSAQVLIWSISILYVMYIFENLCQKSSSALWLLLLLGYYSTLVEKVYASHKKGYRQH